MKHRIGALAGALSLFAAAPCFAQTTLTIATVNNGDMIRMQKPDQQLHREEPGHQPSIGSRWRRTFCASASPPTSPPRAASSTF